jgi:uncharacterized protein YcaQ
MLPWWRRAMLDYRSRHTGWSGWLRRNPKLVAEVKAAVASNGPMANADFESRRPRGGKAGWWSWQPFQHALHHLWMTGALTVHSRRHFQKRFDLLERAMPAVVEVEPVAAAEFTRWHIERSLHALGAATDADLVGYLTFPRFMGAARRATLKDMIERGEVQELPIEGARGRWLALTRDVPALTRAARNRTPSRGTTLLAPFDSLLWYRERVARLFGFEYRIEVYTPGDRRVHGYYTLPILHDGALIGRVDAKTHRAEGRLEIRHVHFEPWFVAGAAAPGGGAPLDQTAALAGLGETFRSLATFVRASSVSVERVTPTRLKRPLVTAASP